MGFSSRRLLLVSGGVGALLWLGSSAPPKPVRPPAAPIPKTGAPRPAKPPAKILKLEEVEKRHLTLPDGTVHVFKANLKQEEFLPLRLDQKGVDVDVVVLGPSGDTLLKVDGHNGDRGPEYVPIMGSAAGEHVIRISGSGKGVYQVEAGPPRRPTYQDRKAAEAAAAEFRGKHFQRLREIPKAEGEFRRAMQAWRESGYALGQGNACIRLGKLLSVSSRWRDAKEAFLCALTSYQKAGERRLEAIAHNDLGRAEKETGDNDRALSCYGQSLTLARKFGLLDVEIRALRNRGILAEALGEYGLALQDFDRALSLSKGLKPPFDRVSEQIVLYNGLGKIHLLLGDLASALEYHGKAKDLLRSHYDDDLAASTLEHLGDVYRKKQDFKKSIAHYERALKTRQELDDRKAEATVLHNLALSYFNAGRTNEARSAFLKAVEIYSSLGYPYERAVASINLGGVMVRLSRFQDAMKAYGEGLKTVQEQRRRPAEAAAYLGMAWAERERGNLSAAQAHLEKALRIIELLRTKADRRELRTSFLAGRQNAYTLMVEVLMERHRREPTAGYDLEAFEWSERARSRSLLDDLEGTLVLPRLSVRDFQKLLDGETVLLEYFLGEQKSFVWVLTSESITSIELESKERILNLARDVQGLMAVSDQYEDREKAISKAADLSRLLFGPVANRLRGQRLLIAAPPELQYISFAALPDLRALGPGARKEWPEPLVLRYRILAVPSATVLEALRRRHESRPAAPKTLAVVADPAFMKEPPEGLPAWKKPLYPLRYSHTEAQKIAAHAPGEVRLFLGPKANRQLVLQGGLRGYGILHFSTHGRLVSDDPGASALVLSNQGPGGKRIESHLTANDIARLDLQCDLVVLSACSTGLGKEIRGEGLVGLTQAFFSAGASRVVASLWDVDARATAELMALFYSNLLQQNLPPDIALQRAQIAMWKNPEWRAPANWAGFVLQGEWR